MTSQASHPHAKKKLAILTSAPANQAAFRHACRLAKAALDHEIIVYFYCLDEAVLGLECPELQAMRSNGLKLFGCAAAAQRRNVPRDERAVFCGLTVLHQMITQTHRFLSFN